MSLGSAHARLYFLSIRIDLNALGDSDQTTGSLEITAHVSGCALYESEGTRQEFPCLVITVGLIIAVGLEKLNIEREALELLDQDSERLWEAATKLIFTLNDRFVHHRTSLKVIRLNR